MTDRTPTGDKTAQCGASSRIGFHYLVPYFGPCVLRAGHDGPVHEDANGVQWTDPRPAKAGDLAALCPPTGDLPDECTGCGRDDGPMYLDPRPRHPRDPQAVYCRDCAADLFDLDDEEADHA